MTIQFARNSADSVQIAGHLQACDSAFEPTLSSRVDISDYAAKIATNAERFEAWESEVLAGLVAVYCNASDKRSAFITSVSVLPKLHGAGIATRLLVECIHHVRKQEIARLQLEVSEYNRPAIALYERCGFATAGHSGSTQVMAMDLFREGR